MLYSQSLVDEHTACCGDLRFSYRALSLYALVSQMGTNHKAALILQWLREMIHGWQRAAQRRRRHGLDNSTIRRDDIELQVMSLEEDEQQSMDMPELQPPNVTLPSPVTDETSPTMFSTVPPVVNVARATVDEIEEY